MTDFGEGDAGEGKKPLKGEGDVSPTIQVLPLEIIEKKLTFEEASRCLNTVGQDESGSRYAYLMITATDRKLTDVSIVLNFKHILFLDLSGNYLTLPALQLLADMPFLIYLKVEHNRINSMAFKPMNYLQVLNLGRNLVKETEELNMPQLSSLGLNYNDISVIHFEQDLKLRTLELRANKLIDIIGEYPTTLEKLYLADNKIEFIDPQVMDNFKDLVVLHLRDNNIRKLTAFGPNLEHLKYLNLRNNNIEKYRHIWKLASLPQLETLIILGNPIYPAEEEQEKAGEDDQQEEVGEGQEMPMRFNKARLQILAILPNLKRLNKMIVTPDERYQASLIRDQVMRMIANEPNSDDESEPVDLLTEYLLKIGDVGE